MPTVPLKSTVECLHLSSSSCFLFQPDPVWQPSKEFKLYLIVIFWNLIIKKVNLTYGSIWSSEMSRANKSNCLSSTMWLYQCCHFNIPNTLWLNVSLNYQLVPDHFCFFLGRRLLPFHLTLVPKPAQKQEMQCCRQNIQSDVSNIIHLVQVKTTLTKELVMHSSY